jgi:hypothetical protein
MDIALIFKRGIVFIVKCLGVVLLVLFLLSITNQNKIKVRKDLLCFKNKIDGHFELINKNEILQAGDMDGDINLFTSNPNRRHLEINNSNWMRCDVDKEISRWFK